MSDPIQKIINHIDHDKTFCWSTNDLIKGFDPSIFVQEHVGKSSPSVISRILHTAGYTSVECRDLDRGDPIIITNGRSILHGVIVLVTPEGDQHIDLHSDWTYSNDVGTFGFPKGTRILNPFQYSPLNKPPLGVMPRWMVLQNRNRCILDALGNYNDSSWYSSATEEMLTEFSLNTKELHGIKHGAT